MKKWTGAFQIASLYVGTIIGAGFATGREIVEFFTQYGFLGFIGIFLSGCLFILFGTKIMLLSINLQASSYEDFNQYLYGKKLARLMNVIMMLMLIGVCAVMLSGAEALFQEQLGFMRGTGSVVTMVLTAIVLAVGVKGLFAVNGFVVPLLVFFNLLVLWEVGQQELAFIHFFHSPATANMSKVMVSAFSYVAFNLALAQAVLVPVASEVGDREIVKLGGWIGGLLLGLVLLSSHLILITLPDPAAFEIPMAIIVKETVSGLFVIYVCIIFGEIFTSIIGNMFGLERQLNRYIKLNKRWISAGILLVVFLIGRVEYGRLLGYLYPLFGYISLSYLLLLTLKNVKKKNG